MLHATAPTRLHQMVEHLPMILVKGTRRSGPKARPATAADIYTASSQRSKGGHCHTARSKKKRVTE